MAVNQGIRSTDLLKLCVKDVEDLKIGEKFFFKEGKTGKQNFIFMNRNTHQALHLYLKFQNMYGSDGYLFPSRSGSNPITLKQFGRLIKEWCHYARVKNLSEYGVRSLRKTFGRLEFENSDNSNVVTLLKERFNHSSESMTIKYLNITTADMEMIFSDK